MSAFWQVTAANGSSPSEVKTAEGASSDEPVKSSNGGSTLGLRTFIINSCANYILHVSFKMSKYSKKNKDHYKATAWLMAVACFILPSVQNPKIIILLPYMTNRSIKIHTFEKMRSAHVVWMMTEEIHCKSSCSFQLYLRSTGELKCYFVCFHTDESSSILGRGRRKKIVSPKGIDQSDGTEGSISDNNDSDKPVYKVNQVGRYICQLCEKTFKTVSHTCHLCVHLLSGNIGYIFLYGHRNNMRFPIC